MVGKETIPFTSIGTEGSSCRRYGPCICSAKSVTSYCIATCQRNDFSVNWSVAILMYMQSHMSGMHFALDDWDQLFADISMHEFDYYSLIVLHVKYLYLYTYCVCIS